MSLTSGLLASVVAAVLVVVYRYRLALGARRAIALGAMVVLAAAVAWGVSTRGPRPEQPPLNDLNASRPISSDTCVACHQSRHSSWHSTFHRTMTREATPENVKAVFDGTPIHHLGVASRMIREGDRYYMDTVDPVWAAQMAQRGIPLDKAGPAPRQKISVDRLVGSHWFQQLLHRDEDGRYLRLPLAYHIVEKRWIHIDGAFLGPDTGHFFSKPNVWNETCVFCHNTRPSKNPQLTLTGALGYRTEVAELGISCEVCHGPGDRHVKAHQNADPGLARPTSGEGDPTIVNPARLTVARRDDICARCHGGPMPRYEAWDPVTQADPFLAGQDLRKFWHVPRSEAEQHLISQGKVPDPSLPPPREPLDGRFWGDGTPLTTALEYQGLAMSKCYENGQGKLSCLSCHAMHRGDPNHQLKEGMRTNAACYQCHEPYRAKLVEHAHHPADSPGSLCANCHMAPQVYSLLDTHRSHRIESPRIRDSLGTGKPHACNLCHTDKSLGWTQDQLGKWYGTKPEPLTDDERSIASSVLELARGDARTRAVVAGALGSPAAQQASGRDWTASLLIRVLEQERYQAVRYTAHKSLRSLHGPAVNDYNYQGDPTQRAAQLRELRRSVGSTPLPNPNRYPFVPFTPTGLFKDDVFDRLLRTRTDPDVSINE